MKGKSENTTKPKINKYKHQWIPKWKGENSVGKPFMITWNVTMDIILHPKKYHAG